LVNTPAIPIPAITAVAGLIVISSRGATANWTQRLTQPSARPTRKPRSAMNLVGRCVRQRRSRRRAYRCRRACKRSGDFRHDQPPEVQHSVIHLTAMSVIVAHRAERKCGSTARGQRSPGCRCAPSESPACRDFNSLQCKTLNARFESNAILRAYKTALQCVIGRHRHREQPHPGA